MTILIFRACTCVKKSDVWNIGVVERCIELRDRIRK